MSYLLISYNTGDDSSDTNWFWVGQTFTTTYPGALTSVKLKFGRTGNPGTMTVSIRNTTAGVPSGGDLCSGTINVNALDTAADWYEITMSVPYDLSASTMYAICCRVSTGTSGNYPSYRRDTSSPSYSGGTRVTGGVDGVTWTIDDTDDYMFEVWGNPSVPTVTTSAATSITYKLATLNGSIDDVGTSNCTIRGFQYGVTSGALDLNVNTVGDYGTGVYSLDLVDLKSSTTYYFRAYATNLTGTSYGTELSFTTSDLYYYPTGDGSENIPDEYPLYTPHFSILRIPQNSYPYANGYVEFPGNYGGTWATDIYVFSLPEVASFSSIVFELQTACNYPFSGFKFVIYKYGYDVWESGAIDPYGGTEWTIPHWETASCPTNPFTGKAWQGNDLVGLYFGINCSRYDGIVRAVSFRLKLVGSLLSSDIVYKRVGRIRHLFRSGVYRNELTFGGFAVQTQVPETYTEDQLNAEILQKLEGVTKTPLPILETPTELTYGNFRKEQSFTMPSQTHDELINATADAEEIIRRTNGNY